MIKCNLSKILGERRITQGMLAKKTGLSLNTIHKLYHDIWQTLDRATIDIICLILKINTGDFFEIIPDSKPTEKRIRRPVAIYQYKKKGEKVLQPYPEEKEQIYSSLEDNTLDACHEDSGNENFSRG